MNKSLIEVQAGYGNPEDDLDWLARNVDSIDPTHNFICRTENDAGYFTALTPEFKAQWFNVSDYINRRAELYNKPSWDDAPKWANWLAQDSNGKWFFYSHECAPEALAFESKNEDAIISIGVEGEVLGDWRNTLEKRPESNTSQKAEPAPDLEYNPNDVAFTHDDQRIFNPFTSEYGPGACLNYNHPDHPLDMVDPLSDLTVSIKQTTCRASMSELYPKYYKDVSKLTELDVYAVHDLFSIDDPSGCIQHASKKLLLCGVRTGGKPAAREIKEARDTLTRKLQLMGVE